MRKATKLRGSDAITKFGKLLSGGVLFATLLFVLLSAAAPFADAAVALPQCAWVYAAKEGEITTSLLQRSWDLDACAGKYVTLTTMAPALSGFVIPNTHLLVVQYTPTITGLMEGEVRYVSQRLSVMCDVFTPLCKQASVYYVVHGTQNTGPTNDTTTTTTTTTTTAAPIPFAPSCPPDGVLPVVRTNITVPARLEPLSYVDNCLAPRHIIISKVSDTMKKLFYIEKGSILWFDRNAENQDEGVFSVELTVYCNEVASCFNIQASFTVVKPSLPPTENPPNCSLAYGFRVFFSQNVSLTITPHKEDACPAGQKAVFTLVSPPKYNAEAFQLDNNTGKFYYAAPTVQWVTSDVFVFVISCAVDTDGTSHPLCTGLAKIIVTSPPSPTPPPPPPPAKEVECPGNFVFNYEMGNESKTAPNTYNLFLEAGRGENVSFCPGGIYTKAELRTKTSTGNLVGFNNTSGVFQYVSSSKSVDHFDFALTCATGRVCNGSATLQPRKNPTPSPEYPSTVYDLGHIVCRGTCDASAWRSSPRYPGLFDVTDWPQKGRSHVTPRRDGKSPDDMDFELRMEGNALLLRAYTIIGNMAARFVTFTPVGDSKSALLTSAYVPDGAHVSFNASCLDQQARSGVASDIWTWDDASETEGGTTLRGHLNTVTDAYKSGENYFQKFGGKHRDCDVYRSDPCKYAPMLTPASTTGVSIANDANAEGVIDWKLYVNNCEATWVGNVSLNRLRMLRNSTTNEPLFKAVNKSLLVGTIYTQVVKPASWVPPYKGILSMQRAYTVRISIDDSVGTEVEVFQVKSSAGVQAEVATKTNKVENISRIQSKLSSVVELPGSENGLFQGSFNVSIDVRFAAAKDPITGERLYGYALLIYPYQLNYSHIKYSVPMLVHLNATQLRATEVQLLNASWTTPNLHDCAQCTGKAVTCAGTGSGLNLDCDPVIRFEPAGNVSLFHESGLTSESEGQFLNISLIARVVGSGTALSATGHPEGSFALRLRFPDSETIVVHVKQLAYITGVNTITHYALCRSSAYWPVPDVLGGSVPANPFNSSQLLHDIFTQPLNGKDKTKKKPYYGVPKPLHSDAFCAANINPHRPGHIFLNSTTTIVTDDGVDAEAQSGSSTVQLSLCTAPDEQVYGVTDWVYLTLRDQLKPLNTSILAKMSLEYLILSVDAKDVLGVFHSNSSDNNIRESKLYFVLDGASLPDKMNDGELGEEAERQHWMGETPIGNSTVYLRWEKYAAYLHYRRIYLRLCPSNNQDEECVHEPFHFAFVPGSLLYRGSPVRVTFHLHAGVRYTSTDDVGESWVEEHIARIPVSAQISSALRFDRDVYTPRVVPRSTGGLSKKSARALFVILALSIVAVLVAAIYIEIYYKRVLRVAKRRLRHHPNCSENRLDKRGPPGVIFSPLEDKDGRAWRDGVEMAGAASGGRSANQLTPKESPESPGIRTGYGVVQVEPARAQVSEDNFGGETSPTSSPQLRVE
ncbi:hypothetical protein TraAM80_01007 [Trypanosoma rangeli]|uniref:Uncharacterized protein n=1 Tax=Trypanosoma rangeli TaxID=5698 RepID=A0A422P0Y6_TRYRA|nr:uncharacterized protein TraAM80_01007 [Trypanosoma rangeli]RNF11390.1 hypothetical protein TraAM80_01007 [Trypanosoma rangeli]|eukprot:RNF11390.1 hypothetical protein TraAM80_01007 [Trypanosoma rangeli]